jgi:LysM repeat protein
MLAIAVLLFAHAATVSAETGSIGIIPAFPKEGNLRSRSIFIHTLKGGEVVEDGVRVYNYTKEARTVKVDAVDQIAASDGSFSCKQNSEKKTEVGQWISLETKQVTIPAQSSELVNFTITVPSGTGPGEHGACITAQDTKNMGSKSGSGVILGFRNAIRVAITVPGNIVKKLTITKLQIDRNDKGNYTVSPISHNSGNVSLDVTSRVQLRGLFGEETKVQSASYPVIAGATTGWAFEFKRPFWGGIYRAYTSIAYNADPASGLGDKAGAEKKIRQDSGYFLMMPTPRALAVELVVPALIIFGLVTYARQRYLRRVAHKRSVAYIVQRGDTLASIAKINGLRWKQLAKLNKIKPPYLLTEGQTLRVPKPGKKRLLRRSSSELDSSWLHDDLQPTKRTDNVVEINAQPHMQQASTGDRAVTYTQDESSQDSDWIAPRSSIPRPRSATLRSVPNPIFPEPDDIAVPDWRDGASDEELAQLGVLKDSASMPQLKSSFAIEDGGAAPEESNSKKRTPAKTRKKPTKSKRTTNKK